MNTSATFLNLELSNTQNGTNDGNDAAGVAKYRFVVGGEYDLSFLTGATLEGKVIRSGSRYLNTVNTVELDPWSRIDTSARYQKIAKRDITWRLNVVINLMNQGYWETTNSFGYLTQGNPREIKLSLFTQF